MINVRFLYLLPLVFNFNRFYYTVLAYRCSCDLIFLNSVHAYRNIGKFEFNICRRVEA